MPTPTGKEPSEQAKRNAQDEPEIGKERVPGAGDEPAAPQKGPITRRETEPA